MSQPLTVKDVADYLGEGFHTAFRKASDTPQADKIWHLIRDMDPAEWSSVLDFVAKPLVDYVKERGLA